MQNRFYPERKNGKLLEYKYDIENGSFEVKWQEDSYNKAPCRLYVPNLKLIPKDEIIVEPKSLFSYQNSDGTNGGWLYIEPSSGGGLRMMSYTLPHPNSR